MPCEHANARCTAVVLAITCMQALLVACSTPSIDAGAPPYDPTSLTSGVVYHWPVGAEIAIHVVPGPAPADDALRASVGESARRWSETLGFREHVLRIVDDPSRADVIVRDARTPSPVDTSCGGPGWTEARATTFFCPLGDTARTLVLLSGPPGITKVLITVNVETLPAASGALPVVLHELGHALGIGGHSPVATDAMFAAPTVSVPSPRDARTLRYLLHRRAGLTL